MAWKLMKRALRSRANIKVRSLLKKLQTTTAVMEAMVDMENQKKVQSPIDQTQIWFHNLLNFQKLKEFQEMTDR